MYYTEVPGVKVAFNIKELGTQVAMLKMGDGPRLLLAGHLDGTLPIFIYRVDNLKKAMKELKVRGWKKGREVEMPHGPACTFTAAGGQRFAIYQLTRPEADNFLRRSAIIDDESGAQLPSGDCQGDTRDASVSR